MLKCSVGSGLTATSLRRQLAKGGAAWPCSFPSPFVYRNRSDRLASCGTWSYRLASGPSPAYDANVRFRGIAVIKSVRSHDFEGPESAINGLTTASTSWATAKIDCPQDFPARLSSKKALLIVSGLEAHSFSKLVVAVALAMSEIGSVTALTSAFQTGCSNSS